MTPETIRPRSRRFERSLRRVLAAREVRRDRSGPRHISLGVLWLLAAGGGVVAVTERWPHEIIGFATLWIGLSLGSALVGTALTQVACTPAALAPLPSLTILKFGLRKVLTAHAWILLPGFGAAMTAFAYRFAGLSLTSPATWAAIAAAAIGAALMAETIARLYALISLWWRPLIPPPLLWVGGMAVLFLTAQFGGSIPIPPEVIEIFRPLAWPLQIFDADWIAAGLIAGAVGAAAAAADSFLLRALSRRLRDDWLEPATETWIEGPDDDDEEDLTEPSDSPETSPESAQALRPEDVRACLAAANLFGSGWIDAVIRRFFNAEDRRAAELFLPDKRSFTRRWLLGLALGILCWLLAVPDIPQAGFLYPVAIAQIMGTVLLGIAAFFLIVPLGSGFPPHWGAALEVAPWKPRLAFRIVAKITLVRAAAAALAIAGAAGIAELVDAFPPPRHTALDPRELAWLAAVVIPALAVAAAPFFVAYRLESYCQRTPLAVAAFWLVCAPISLGAMLAAVTLAGAAANIWLHDNDAAAAATLGAAALAAALIAGAVPFLWFSVVWKLGKTDPAS